jgi:hypothetical protein
MYFGCMGTQRFTAEGGRPRWECSEDRDHFEPTIDFSDEGRAKRMDIILNDLRVLEHEASSVRDPLEREQMGRHIRLLTARMQAERNHIKFPKKP